MRTYNWTETTVDGAPDEWVPADVARGLYDALREMKDMAERCDSWESFPSAPIDRADEALAAADGEEV